MPRRASQPFGVPGSGEALWLKAIRSSWSILRTNASVRSDAPAIPLGEPRIDYVVAACVVVVCAAFAAAFFRDASLGAFAGAFAAFLGVAFLVAALGAPASARFCA